MITSKIYIISVAFRRPFNELAAMIRSTKFQNSRFLMHAYQNGLANNSRTTTLFTREFFVVL